MKRHEDSSTVAGRLLVAFLAIVVAAGAYLSTGSQPTELQALLGPQWWQQAVAAAVGAVAVLALPRRSWPVLAAALVLAPLHATTIPLQWVAAFVAASTFRSARRLAGYVVALILALAGLAIVQDVADGTEILAALGSATALVGIPVLAGLWTKARREVVAGLRERAAQLEREQVARANEARAEERARIARDMHDVVAHRVSLMVLHAGALQCNTTEEPLIAEAELIRTTGQEALAQLRAVLGVLTNGRQEPVPQQGLAELDRMLNQSRLAGVSITRRDSGELRPLPMLVENAIYRVTQEALTNVHKHAGAAATQVLLDYRDDQIVLEVINAPAGATGDRLPGSGLGLVGLRERVELLGGEFSAEPRADGGFTVRTTLPAPALEPTEKTPGEAGAT